MNPAILFSGSSGPWRFVPWPPGKLSESVVVCECQAEKAKRAGKPIDVPTLSLMEVTPWLAVAKCHECRQNIWTCRDFPALIRVCEERSVRHDACGYQG